jgi:hypothetical protein
MPDSVVSTFSFPFMLFLGFLFQGVLSDFQEAQRIPGHLAVALETLLERASFIGAQAAKKGLASPAPLLHTELLEYVLCMFENFAGLRTHLDMLALTSALGSCYAEGVSLLPAVVEPDAWAVWATSEQLRTGLVRMATIKRTDFLASGHLLMQWITAFLVAMFTLASYTDSIGCEEGERGLGRPRAV